MGGVNETNNKKTKSSFPCWILNSGPWECKASNSTTEPRPSLKKKTANQALNWLYSHNDPEPILLVPYAWRGGKGDFQSYVIRLIFFNNPYMSTHFYNFFVSFENHGKELARSFLGKLEWGRVGSGTRHECSSTRAVWRVFQLGASGKPRRGRSCIRSFSSLKRNPEPRVAEASLGPRDGASGRHLLTPEQLSSGSTVHTVAKVRGRDEDKRGHGQGRGFPTRFAGVAVGRAGGAEPGLLLKQGDLPARCLAQLGLSAPSYHALILAAASQG